MDVREAPRRDVAVTGPQRNFPLETGIPRDVHGAETPVADGPADLQRPYVSRAKGGTSESEADAVGQLLSDEEG